MLDTNAYDDRGLWVGRVQYPPVAVSREFHRHDFHELVLIIKGDYFVDLDGETLHLKPGDYLFFPPKLAHRPHPRTNMTQFYVMQWQEDTPLRETYVHGRDHTLRISMLLDWIWSSYPTESLETRELHHALLQVIKLACLVKQQVLRRDDPVEEVEHYLRNIIHADVSMAEIADFVSLSPRHITRLFREKHGVTPKQYLLDLRLQHAANLLTSTQHSLKEIAERSGFNSGLNLRRSFQKRYGMTPGQYKSSRGGA